MSKKHNLKKKIIFAILPFFINIIQKLIYLSCFKKFELSSVPMSTPVIWVGWHGQLLMLPYPFRKLRPIPAKINIIVSEHAHGEMAIKSSKSFKFNYIRGSSRKGAVKALIQAIKALELGEDVGITPDGPKGPAYFVADGVITLASKCTAPIVACAWRASSFWQLKGWDKTMIPKPFSTITFRTSEPLFIQNMEKDEAKKLVHDAIMKCMNS